MRRPPAPAPQVTTAPDEPSWFQNALASARRDLAATPARFLPTRSRRRRETGLDTEPDILPEHTIAVSQFMVLNAVRYAVARPTYMASMVADELIRISPHLNRKERRLILRDLHADMRGLSLPSDIVAVWQAAVDTLIADAPDDLIQGLEAHPTWQRTLTTRSPRTTNEGF